MNERDTERLAALDDAYDAASGLITEAVRTPSYHTHLHGRARPTRGNLEYARLLWRAGPDRHARAADVTERVLRLQDADPVSPTFGLWPWYAEESIAGMMAPDWNWADFCGALLAEMLTESGGAVPDALAGRMRAALDRAAQEIFRRNMGPHYTNIALMGAGVTAAAGEILGDDRHLAYGRRRLEAFVRHTEKHGSFNEYNSPTYTRIAIDECERMLRLCRDPEIRRNAEWARRIGWRIAADHFFAPAFEWGGPQSRSYGIRLTPVERAWLRERLDAPASDPHACPADCRDAFFRLAAESWARHVYEVDNEGRPCATGSVWRSPEACLGTVDEGIYWDQRRPLLAYWPVPGGPAAVFRARFLKDGIDFSSCAASTEQDRTRGRTRAYFRTDRGDFHPYRCPPEPLFTGSDWRWRFVLDAGDAEVACRGDGYRFTSAAMRMDVRPAPGARFFGRPVRWETGGADGAVWADAVCHTGAAATFDLREAAAGTALSADFALARRDAPDGLIRPG